MNSNTKDQIRLQSEIAALAGSHALLRDLYLHNFSPDLLVAMESIIKRIQTAETELDIAISALDINDALPVISVTSTRKQRL